MKRFSIILLCFLNIFTNVSASETTDSTSTDTAEASSTLSLNAYLLSRYEWRGVIFGSNSPSIQGFVGYESKNGKIFAGAYVCKTMNGETVGFGNTSELIIGYSPIEELTILVDDYFFFDEHNLDDYFDWGDTTYHFVEAQLHFQKNKFRAMAGYNLYAHKDAKTDAIYIEAGYQVAPDVEFYIGYLTGESTLNFYSEGGVTSVGINTEKQIKITKKYYLPITAKLRVNPNYRNIESLDGVTRSAVALVLGTYF